MFNSSSATKKAGLSILEKISKSELLEVSKPWLQMAARTAGVKSLYDVPEYFRERLELRGVKIGQKTFGKGLGGATEELLDKSNASTKPSGLGTSRKELYKELLHLEKQNLTNSPEYKNLEAQIESTRPSEVRDAIKVVNKKLSLTKEGEQKNSEARKEMSRILRENRNKEKADRQGVGAQVTTLLNDYTTQKVDGITAAKEALRTALAVGGVNGVMTIANLGFDAATLLRDSAQSARRSGEEFNSKVVAKKMGLEVKNTWQKITGKGDGGEGLLNRSSAVAKVSQLAAKFGIGGEVSLGTVGGSVETLLNKAAVKFPKIPSEVRPILYSRTNLAKSAPGISSDSVATPSSKLPESKRARDSTRNVQTNTARKPNPTSSLGSNQPTHIRFNESYSEAGLQPSVGSVRNISAEYKKQGGNDPSVRRGGVADQPSANFLPAPRKKPKREKAQPRQSLNEDPSDYTPHASKNLLAQKNARDKEEQKIKVVAARKLAGVVNRIIWGIGFPVWLFVQLPFAIFIFVLFLGTSVLSFLPYSSELFSVFYIFFIGLAMIQILVIYFFYKFLGLEPLGGEGSGFKYGTLIIVIIGYLIPLVNLFPWFYVWTFAVWLKPK